MTAAQVAAGTARGGDATARMVADDGHRIMAIQRQVLLQRRVE